MRLFSIISLFFIFNCSALKAQDSTAHIPKYKARMVAVIAAESALYLGSMAYLQFVWYRDKERVPFEWYRDGKGYKQIDKFGHAFGSYLESYIGYHALRWSGVSKTKALIFGGTLGIVLQTPIEIWDGMYEGWGFSWGDMAANTIGSVLVIGQELAFNGQPIKYKWGFTRSGYAQQANGYLGNGLAEEIFNDYNGHIYWLSAGLHHLIPSKKIPAWLNVAAGYGANGMFGEFKNIKRYRGVNIPETERYRQYYLSLDVDWTKIPTRNQILKKIFNAMFWIKLPFPALEFNSKSQLVFHPLHF